MAAHSTPPQVESETFGGVVRSAIPGRVVVLCDDGSETACLVPKRVSAAIGGKVVVGDRVRWQRATGSDGTIVEVLPRRTTLARRSPGHKGGELVMAANLDLLLAVFAAAEPEPRWGMLDRFLVIAESAKISPLIVVTKIEIGDRAAIARELERYHAVGYQSQLVSTRTGEGMDELRARLAGKVSALSGKSGVGKTTLFNALLPGASERTGEVSQMTGKGKHTTSASMLWPLEKPLGGALIDTPGVRELGLWEIDPLDLSSCLPEIRPLLGQCRFAGSCTHSHEVGCAVKSAVEAGAIHPKRYEAYLRMLRGDEVE